MAYQKEDLLATERVIHIGTREMVEQATIDNSHISSDKKLTPTMEW